MTKKTKLLLTILLLTISCQVPVIKKLTPDIPVPILTANQSYTRSGFQSFDLNDSLKIIQTESLGGLPYFSFLQYSGELIYTTHNGRLFFTNLNDFDDSRRTNIGDGIGTAPTIYNSTLFIAVNRGKFGLVAYDMIKGNHKWELRGNYSQSSPIIVNDLVIHATTLGTIAAYDINSIEKKWQVEINDRILNNLAFAENNLIVLTQNGTLRSYNPDNGSLNWSIEIDDAFYASPVLNSSDVFTVGYNGSITKIDLLKGTVLNSNEGNTNIFQTPALDNQHLYVAKGNGQLTALAIKTLDEEWSQQLEGPITTAPLVSNSEIILGTAARKLYRVNKKDGTIIQMIKLQGRPRSQPVYHNNKIYISYEPEYIAVLSNEANDE